MTQEGEIILSPTIANLSFQVVYNPGLLISACIAFTYVYMVPDAVYMEHILVPHKLKT